MAKLKKKSSTIADVVRRLSDEAFALSDVGIFTPEEVAVLPQAGIYTLGEVVGAMNGPSGDKPPRSADGKLVVSPKQWDSVTTKILKGVKGLPKSLVDKWEVPATSTTSPQPKAVNTNPVVSVVKEGDEEEPTFWEDFFGIRFKNKKEKK